MTLLSPLMCRNLHNSLRISIQRVAQLREDLEAAAILCKSERRFLQPIRANAIDGILE